MKTSVCWWCLTQFVGNVIGSGEPFLRPTCPSEATCPEYARAAISRLGGTEWTQGYAPSST